MTERFETFTVLIAAINRCIHRIKSEEMAEFNLKSSHVSCLYYLFKEVSLTATQLCDLCGEDKANISRAIKYLETNGYLKCDSNCKKRYQSALTLTIEGEMIGARIAEKVDNILKLTSVGLTEKERMQMYESLMVVKRNLDQICNSYETL